jgi:predicted RNA binding protein YcfA (HicA-like mRNA interferase family)
VNGAELLRKLAALAKEDGVSVRLDETHGKGSHATLLYGANRTTLKDRRKEIGRGLLRKMLKDLGIDPRRMR